MDGVSISTDELVFWRWEAWPAVKLNATIVSTWVVMFLLVVVARFTTRRLSAETRIPPLQNVLEVIVEGIRGQIREVSGQDPGPYLPFIGTLFLFIAAANILSIVPGYQPPTGSLSTTAALATCVFAAVPLYGVAAQGVLSYLRQYSRPTLFMLPFNMIGELSRTLALAVRLYGNMMSGTVIAGILIGFTPLFVPILMQLLGLLTGMIQAYIFAVLAMVYIASATKVHHETAVSPDSQSLDEHADDPSEGPHDANAESPLGP